MLSKTFSIGENKWGLKEGESSMDPNFAVENLSVSLQSCEPFCTTEIDSSKSSVAEDTLRTDVIVGALNSISIVEPSGQKDDEVKDTVRYDDSSETKCPDIVCSSPQRSNNMNGLQLKTEPKRASRKGRKISSKKLLLDLNSLKVSRRRRSCFCKKTRLSDWGSLENIGQVFKQNAEFDVNQIEHKKLTEARSGRRGGKQNKNQKPRSSQRSKEESHASTSCIRLKVTLGKEVGHSRPMDIIPVTVNVGKDYCGTRKESPKFTKCIENKFEEQIPSNTGVQYCNGKMDKKILLSGACVLDVVHLADKDIAEKVVGKIADDHDLVPAQKEADLLEVAVDNRCLDPGTSPDSEVINLIPECQISGKVSEVLDDVLITSQDFVAFGDVSSLSLPQPSSKKGNKKNKLQQAVNCNVEADLLGPEIINSAGVTEKYGYLESMGDGSFSSEVSISTTSGNVSFNTSSGDIFLMEPSPPSSRVTDFGVSTETLKVESGSVGDLCSTLGVRHELGIPDKFLPCTNKKGHKLSKSSMSTKSRSEVPQPMCSKGNSCRQKGNQSKRNVKEKGDSVQAIFKENDSEKGSHTLDLGESKTGCSTAPDVSYLGLVTSGVRDQYVPPRNAWVSCDDCYKWRRIPVALADSIEETKSHWICKDNMDKNLADCSIPQEKSNAEINAELDISDASCEEDAGDALLNSNRLGQKQSTVSQQSSWKLIRSNLFLHRTRKTQIIDEIMVCHCKAPLGGRMGCGDGCLNRMLNIECVKGTCPCGELCSNNQFQKRKYAKLKCFRSGKKGYGLQLLEDIHEGQFLIEYVGEVLDMHAYEGRQREYALKSHKHFYFMTLNGSEVIDACAKGNLGRFINHSCEPNCRTEKWMVNGEVCIGIFALRDIKKGEEVTFDYNYVRVFGAAAKKCVCGSSLCRGYIGGDPLNAEVIVQGDSDEEYLEPVRFSEDGGDNLGNIISATSSVDVTKTGNAEKDVNQRANAVEHLDVTKEMHALESLSLERKQTNNDAIAGFMEMFLENEETTQRASSAGSKLESLVEMDGLGLSQSMQTLETSLQPDDGKFEITSAAQKESSVAEETMHKSLSTIRRSETSSLTRTLSKSLLDATDIKRKSKYDTKEDRNVVSTSRPIMKTSRSSSSVKKGKSRKSDVHVNKPADIVNKLHQVPHRSKKPMEGSSNDPFEAVQVKLNELLDADGGISKRKDASRGYLKLLFLTAASGDSGNGEAIQSNRDLSMILDALLKTKSRTVLVDIINKNGLQMLHNIMKRYRKEFHKIPILRKLLKVLEYLAVREILTLEHITSGPRCAGVESFRESILSLTEHIDKQVHQIARDFRDKWIPRPIRKRSYMDRDVGRMDFHRGALNCNRLSALYSQSCDLGRRQPEAIDCIKQPLPATTQDGAGSVDSCSASCNSGFVTNGIRIRKRKSRWDQPAETNLGTVSPPHKEPRIQPIFIQKSHLSPQPEIIEVPFDHVAGIIGEDKSFTRSVDHSSQKINTKNVDDGGKNFDEDVPPGFSPLNGSLVSSNASSTASGLHKESGFRSEYRCEAVMGQPQERFISRLPMSFGIPLPVVQQFGTPQGETAGSWAVAAGIPFHPYPPLPPYPHDRRGPTHAASSLTVKSAVKVEGFHNPATHHSDQNILSTSSANPQHMEIPGSINQHNFQRIRGTSNCLGRKYFRQQKWNNANMVPPWVRSRPGRGNMGDNPGNGMNCIGIGTGVNEPKHPYNSEQVHGVVTCGNTSYQHRQYQN